MTLGRDITINHINHDPKLIRQDGASSLLKVGQFVYLDDEGIFRPALATSIKTSTVVGVVWELVGDDAFYLKTSPGPMSYKFPLTKDFFNVDGNGRVDENSPKSDKIPGDLGNKLFLSETLPGEMQTTPPDNIDFQVILGMKTSYGFYCETNILFIPDSGITTVKIRDENVTTDKLADSAVTTVKINDLAVTNSKLSDLAVSTDKISGGSVTTDKLHDLSVTTDKIVDLAVTTAKISGGAVTTEKIADDSISTVKIEDGAVTSAKLDTGLLTNFIPVGAMLDYAGTSAPSGWALCDGTAISRSAFASLFSAIGTTFGVGDGSTTFNLPDFRGRVSVGSGTGAGLTARTIGQTVGEEAHALSSAELAPHTHTIGTNGVATTGNNSVLRVGGAIDVDRTTGSTGTGTAHNIMQPSLVCTKIIRTI